MSTTSKKALVVGASGLTGSNLLELLLNDPHYELITVYVRKVLPISHPKLVQHITDLDTLDSAVDATDVFCCLGTTIKKAGSQEAFRKVDLDYPLKVARLQKAAGSTHFLLISAIGANPQSSIFYSRTKGEVETAIEALGYPFYSIFQPSLIQGNREERRMGEKIAMQVMPIFSPLLVGSWCKYRPIPASSLAKAMRYTAHNPKTGKQLYRYTEIKANAEK